MEPTSEELKAMTAVGALCEIADLGGTDRESFLKILGATDTTKTIVIANIPEAMWDKAVADWKLADGAAPSMVQQAAAGYVGTLARLAAGKAATRSQEERIKKLEEDVVHAKATIPVAASASSGLIKLSSVVDQGFAVEKEVAPMTEDEFNEYYKVYRDKMGNDPRPEEDITIEQLTGLRALFRSGAAPYVDLSIWGPFGARTQRRLKMAGVTLGSDGTIQQVQMPGPPNVESWQEGFGVFRTGCIMLDQISIATLGMWSQMVVDYSHRYGPRVWPLVYQAEVRARSELLTRTKRAGIEAKAQATAAGGVHPFNTAVPWEWVFNQAANNDKFWRKELEDKALLVVAKISGAEEGVEGDAPTSGAPPLKQVQHLAHPPQPASDRQTKRQKTGGRAHKVGDDGLLTHNRAGTRLCAAYQRGECPESGHRYNTACPRDRSLRHQCAKCLQPGHGASSCTGQAAGEPSRKKGSGKGAKGKGAKSY